MAQNGKLSQVVTPSNFIVNTRTNKLIAGVIYIMQVAQTSITSKAQSKIVLNVGHLHFALGVAIVLPIHSLHLTQMPSRTQGWELK